MLKLVNWKETVVDPDQELSGVACSKIFFFALSWFLVLWFAKRARYFKRALLVTLTSRNKKEEGEGVCRDAKSLYIYHLQKRKASTAPTCGFVLSELSLKGYKKSLINNFLYVLFK